VAADIEMSTEDVQVFMGRLAELADGFDSVWAGHRATIGDGESGIGGDLLGAAFAGGYRRAADVLRGATDLVPPAMHGMSDVGHACVGLYLAADRAASALFPGARA
jgi:hypothetical protein